MNCKAVQACLSAFIDREVDVNEMRCIRAHLADCECCRREESDLRCLKSLLSGAPCFEPPADLESRLMSGIRRPAQRTGNRAVGRLGQFALVASVAAAVMLVGLRLFGGREESIRSVSDLPDITADVRRDQVYEAASTEPLYGAPVITADDGR